MSLPATFQRFFTAVLILATLLNAALAPRAAAQTPTAPDADCQPAWVPTFGAEGVEGPVSAMTLFDDGSGPALYATGTFMTAGGVPVNNIAKWDGQSWSPVGRGLKGYPITTLTVFDDGTGPALYVGGGIHMAGSAAVNNIAKWDGQSWSPVGSGLNNTVASLAIFDDGTGPALYAGGSFTLAGGVPASFVARWDGHVWSPLGSGINLLPNQSVTALTVFDDGAGPALYAGATPPPPPPDFITEASAPMNNIAKWDGQSWSLLGSGIDGSVTALAVFDDGTGTALYAGGSFAAAGGIAANNIARWDGQSWAPLGKGVRGINFQFVSALIILDNGTGAALYVGGAFTTAGSIPANNIARWDGQSWAPLGSGVGDGGVGSYEWILTLAVFNDGSGPALFTGGRFSIAGRKPASSVAQWDGKSWATVGSAMSDRVYKLAVFDDGSGPALFAGGSFTGAQGVALSHIGKWDGQSWSPLGGGLDGGVNALAVFDDGTGPALYVGGFFTAAGGVPAKGIAKWDGQTWSSLGNGMSNGLNTDTIGAIAVFDDGSGPALYAAGVITTPVNSITFSVAKWDGQSWAPLGSGLSSSVNINGNNYTFVSALTVFDDGSGPALYVGGFFSSAGGIGANSIARWDGQSWAPLGKGVRGVNVPSVNALTVLDDGTGAALYVGGNFTTAGSIPANNIAKWDGQSWSPLANGLIADHSDTIAVFSLTVFNEGSGPALYAGGNITTAGDVASNHIAKWDGQQWSPVESGTNDVVHAMTVFDDGSDPALFVGGAFTASSSRDAFIAKYQGCAVTNPADFDGDGAVNGADLSLLLANWGPCLLGGVCGGDLDANGVVDAADLATLLANWG